jgi:hypothetical protein
MGSSKALTCARDHLAVGRSCMSIHRDVAATRHSSAADSALDQAGWTLMRVAHLMRSGDWSGCTVFSGLEPRVRVLRVVWHRDPGCAC